MVIVVKGGGRAPPTLTSQANFTLMMECTPESGRYHSVYTLWGRRTRLPWGGGGPNSDEGPDTLVLYLLYNVIPLRYSVSVSSEEFCWIKTAPSRPSL